MARVEGEHIRHLLKTPKRKIAKRRRKGKHYFRLVFAYLECYPLDAISICDQEVDVNREELFVFLDKSRLGVLTTIGPDGGPQAALVGIALTPELEIVFDTVQKSRKAGNLARDPRAAFVVGWEGEQTVQYEGVARRISSTELGPYHHVYFRKFPDGPERLKWEGIQYYVVTPKWIRYSDYDAAPPQIVEQAFS